MFNRVSYNSLNSRQKENYNFAKIAARLADYGYNCMRLSDDWQGADFIASHFNDETFLKVQLKGRLAIDRKYCNKEVYIAFLYEDNCFIFPHDEFLDHTKKRGSLGARGSTNLWDSRGIRSWPTPPLWALDWLADYKI